MNRRTIIYAILACAVTIYIIVMVPMTNKAERNDTFAGLEIRVNDPQGIGFLKKSEIFDIVDELGYGFDTLKRKNLNTYEVERLLNANNRIESSSCRILNDGTLLITVDPIDPVARVFDKEGSVYVNAEGKRVPAHPSYHVDVPVVTTTKVADTTMVKKILPLLRNIKTNARANALVSSLRIDDKGDIIIIPNVVGHVINFGDTTLIDNKFERLHVFYRDVMPVRGWDSFDTISLKWAGRVVATKRDKTTTGKLALDNLDEIVNEVLDDEVMMVD